MQMTYQVGYFSIKLKWQILNKLKTIDIGDIVTINGSYVNVYGRQGNNDITYSWTTDTNIGDSNFEIILVDSISFS